MLSIIARTRPSRSPSHPNTNPPPAAPTRNNAVIRPIHNPTNWSGAPAAASGIMDCNAGRATSGKMPISSPSNIHPRNAAASTSHCARTPAMWAGGGAVETPSVIEELSRGRFQVP